MSTNPFFQSFTVTAHGPIDSKRVLNGLYLRFLEEEPHLPISETLYAAGWATGATQIVEIKGSSATAEVIEFPREMDSFWLVYQFFGNSVISVSESRSLKSGQHIGCSINADQQLICRIDRGKTWMLLIGISGAALQPLRLEFPALAHETRSPLAIGYRQKIPFDKIQQLKAGGFTLDIKLNYYIAALVEQYQSDLSAHQKAIDSADIALYHKATAYIGQHYMERKLTRQKIADALYVSVRTLTRAFEGKQVTISRAVQLARLYKAREWLRGDGDITIDHAASEMHFADTATFVQSYTELFKIAPDADRKRG